MPFITLRASRSTMRPDGSYRIWLLARPALEVDPALDHVNPGVSINGQRWSETVKERGGDCGSSSRRYWPRLVWSHAERPQSNRVGVTDRQRPHGRRRGSRSWHPVTN